MKKRFSYKFLGVKVDALSIPELNLLIEESVEKKQKWIIANHNMHSLYLFHNDPEMQAFYAQAEYIHIDGMPLLLIGKLLGFPMKREQRVTYADWIWPLMAEAANKGWRVFYLGSKPGIAEEGASILREKFPGLEIGCAHGYIDMDKDSQENLATLAAINAYKPHVLMVGMGMPRQEHWISENLEYIHANSILTSGACMDYVAGVIPTPPRWMGRVGLEWLYRLVSEPKRLWRRYLLEPWFVATLFLREIWSMPSQQKKNRMLRFLSTRFHKFVA
ncbi:MAG: WecB/TagA/CpsF family glycosyltransferase [Nostoc sp.]|uniref:WecB/TagA/CpsF family glycosyltransferase n=1 Tax=Nostoc sp. TaxID=1180 RepID=UPI002FF90C26